MLVTILCGRLINVMLVSILCGNSCYVGSLVCSMHAEFSRCLSVI